MSIQPESCTDRSRSVIQWLRPGVWAGWFHSGPKLGSPSAFLTALRHAASAEDLDENHDFFSGSGSSYVIGLKSYQRTSECSCLSSGNQ